MAYRKIYKRTRDGESAKTLGQLYLLHLDTPLKHAQHYLGWSSNATLRIDEHRKGTGCNFIRVVCEVGISFSVAWIKDGKTRLDERKMKNQGGLAKRCPICKASKPHRFVPIVVDGDISRDSKVCAVCDRKH